MGNRTRLQFIQQHTSPCNRPLRSRNHSTSKRRHVRKSRPTRILTIRSHEMRKPRSANGKRQRHNSHPHKSTRTRRIRTKNTRPRRTSGNTSFSQSRIPHRTHRRSYADPARRNEKKRRTSRTKSVAGEKPIWKSK